MQIMPFSDLCITIFIKFQYLSYTFQRQKEIYINLSFSFIIIYPTFQIFQKFISSKLYSFLSPSTHSILKQASKKILNLPVEFPVFHAILVPLSLAFKTRCIHRLSAKIPFSRDLPPRKHDFIIQISCRLRVHVGKLAVGQGRVKKNSSGW